MMTAGFLRPGIAGMGFEGFVLDYLDQHGALLHTVLDGYTAVANVVALRRLVGGSLLW